MRRILLITTRIDEGGAERYLYEHIRHMNRDDLEIDYYLLYESDSKKMKESYEALGVRVFERKLKKKGILRLFSYGKDLRRFLKKKSYDVIHVNGTASLLQLCTMMVAVSEKVPTRILHSHSTSSLDHSFFERVNQVAKVGAAFFATDLFACSEKAGLYKYGRRGLNSSKFQVLKNGIDTKRFSYSAEIREQVRRELGWSEKYICLHVGRLSIEKNQRFLLKIWEDFQARGEEIYLTFVGSGPEEVALKRWVKEKKLEKYVTFLGSREDVEYLLQGADLFCLPSFFEGFPLVVLEAQSTGLPCIVSEGVPKEVNLTQKVTSLSLSHLKGWAETLLSRPKSQGREDASAVILNKGYDICKTADELRKHYQKRGKSSYARID